MRPCSEENQTSLNHAFEAWLEQNSISPATAGVSALLIIQVHLEDQVFLCSYFLCS